MSDELLERATRAMRETRPPSSCDAGDGELGRRRLARALSAPPRVGKKRVVVVALVAASFATTAWAALTGRIPELMRDSVEAPAPTSTSTAAVPRGEVPPAAPSTAAAPSASTLPSPSPRNEPPLVTASAAPPLSASSRNDAPSVTASPLPSSSPADQVPSDASQAAVAPTASAPDLDALYREAHEAHFVRKDPAGALAAWDRYLGAASHDGRMTLEARYNRAIALVRLGRTDDAKRALQPFARGEYGGYRREEANRLIESMR